MDVLHLVSLFLTTVAYCHTTFNISSVPIIITPDACMPHTFLAIIIHTNPHHRNLRDMLRQTWAREADGEKKVKRVFVIGQVEDEELANSLVEESDRFGDLLQVVLCDDYNAIQCLRLGWLCR